MRIPGYSSVSIYIFNLLFMQETNPCLYIIFAYPCADIPREMGEVIKDEIISNPARRMKKEIKILKCTTIPVIKSDCVCVSCGD